jgi:hypothetical protein
MATARLVAMVSTVSRTPVTPGGEGSGRLVTDTTPVASSVGRLSDFGGLHDNALPWPKIGTKGTGGTQLREGVPSGIDKK